MSDHHSSDGEGLIEVVVVLVGLQAAIGFTGVVEALVFASFFGSSAMAGAALTALAAVAAAVCAIALGRRAGWARRPTMVAEAAVLALALLDVLLAPLLLGAEVALVSVLARIVLPAVVIGLLRRPSVRAALARSSDPPTSLEVLA